MRRVGRLTIVSGLPFLGLLCALAQSPEKPGTGTSSSRQAHPSAKVPKQGTSGQTPNLGEVHEGEYRNVAFAITYKTPFGWVQRTDSMRDAAAAQKKSYVLFAAFERPPEATADSVNSAVIITAENLSEYPGLDQAVDYFDILDDITTRNGFKVVNPPYEFPVGAEKLARGDYSKKIANAVTMYQGELVMLRGNFVVLFTFVAGSEDELESLVMDLKLGPAGKRAAPPK